MDRKSGVLMHISSLFGDYSIGSFGEEAKVFIDFLKECGFTYWQVLPFCMADQYNSPYQSYSAFGGNPYFVDLNVLHKKGLLTLEELNSAKQKTPYVAEYERLWEERFSLLKTASMRITDRSKIAAFLESNPHIKDFCEFMAFKDANHHLPWNEWDIKEYDEAIYHAWAMIQYEFFTQWQEIKGYANEKGIKLIGDMPIYVSYDSCDVWANQDQFQLSEDGRPTLVAGVPPDYFSEDGQLWGNPLYAWDKMKEDGYRWWCERISHIATLFDAVRIDHFRAFESYWAVPSDAKTAKEGSWKQGPGLEFIQAITKAAGESQIIAEDLGDITPEVHQLVKDSGFPGMRVFQFGFLSHGDSLHKPHHYPKHSVAYTGTHDNNTLLGYLWELPDHLRSEMLAYCGHEGDWGNGCRSIIRMVMASHSDWVILPIQDLLFYGSDTRLNTPGKAEGNWQFRITKEQLDSVDKAYFKELNRRYARE